LSVEHFAFLILLTLPATPSMARQARGSTGKQNLYMLKFPIGVKEHGQSFGASTLIFSSQHNAPSSLFEQSTAYVNIM
jgi:hypothetical protein